MLVVWIKREKKKLSKAFCYFTFKARCVRVCCSLARIFSNAFSRGDRKSVCRVVECVCVCVCGLAASEEEL